MFLALGSRAGFLYSLALIDCSNCLLCLLALTACLDCFDCLRLLLALIALSPASGPRAGLILKDISPARRKREVSYTIGEGAGRTPRVFPTQGARFREE